MKGRAFRSLQVILLIPLAYGFCQEQRSVTVVFDQQSFHRAKTVLDFKVDKATIPGRPISQALLDIARSLQSTSGGKLHFSFGLEQTERLGDPIVALSASHLSVRQLLDLLCAQAKWKYRQTPIGIMFSPR